MRNDAAREQPHAVLLDKVVLIQAATEHGLTLDVQDRSATSGATRHAPRRDVGEVMARSASWMFAVLPGEGVELRAPGNMTRLDAFTADRDKGPVLCKAFCPTGPVVEVNGKPIASVQVENLSSIRTTQRILVASGQGAPPIDGQRQS